ncbi:helix-turn-helix transcriptional regulator [Enterococcus dongliensis]|uniref:helix-turn-helix transcriptional regulator n=1 Tax=Enterococcus dongliensis TaxID=2559925 RepID=UPI00289056EA|nr:helix-turn-helix transcriptional regulator [Enterococcus dongliensis]MDT2674301.1 helix-turn-helix transcriptional regulator [Enterococcus dongliensis]
MNRIKELREEKNLTQKELAQKIGISDASVNKYEKNTMNPKIDKLEKMAEIFDVSVAYISGKGTSDNKNKLKELRESFGLSLGDLSEELQKKGFKVGRASLNNYENGIQQPKQETWEHLADYFDVSVAYIMGLNTALNKNEISISKLEYERLKAIEQKYNEIKSLVTD